MFTNKQLTPIERTIYVREMGGERMAIIRIGNKTYGMRAVMSEYKNDTEWTAACEQIIKMCRQSASFFETFGIDYFDAPRNIQMSEYALKDYPVKYFMHA